MTFTWSHDGRKDCCETPIGPISVYRLTPSHGRRHVAAFKGVRLSANEHKEAAPARQEAEDYVRRSLGVS